MSNSIVQRLAVIEASLYAYTQLALLQLNNVTIEKTFCNFVNENGLTNELYSFGAYFLGISLHKNEGVVQKQSLLLKKTTEIKNELGDLTTFHKTKNQTFAFQVNPGNEKQEARIERFIGAIKAVIINNKATKLEILDHVAVELKFNACPVNLVQNLTLLDLAWNTAVKRNEIKEVYKVKGLGNVQNYSVIIPPVEETYLNYFAPVENNVRKEVMANIDNIAKTTKTESLSAFMIEALDPQVGEYVCELIKCYSKHHATNVKTVRLV